MLYPLPETTLNSAATEVRYIERSAHIDHVIAPSLGPGFADPKTITFFQPRRMSADVRNFVIDDSFLDTAAMVLVKSGHKVSDTRYLLPNHRYDAVKIVPTGLMRLEPGYEYAVVRSFDNWYHWLTQTLPAIDHVSRGEAGNRTRILLHPLQRPWQRESFTLLGFSECPLIELDSRHHYHLPRVQYCEFVNGRTSFQVSLSALGTYRKLRDAALKPGFTGPKIIYVARTDTKLRKLDNEANIVDALTRAGVTSVVPGQFSLSEQINLFYNADAIIGAHGAGLSNVAFCRPGTIFYEFHPAHYLNPCMARLAQAAELRYMADAFPSYGEGGTHDRRWAPDVSRLLQRVDELRSLLPKPPPRSTERSTPVRSNGMRHPLVLPAEIMAVPGQHRKAISKALRMEPAPINSQTGPRIVLVCFTNRSGSNLLCETLSATGHFNAAHELLNGDVVLDTCRKEGLVTLGAYFDHIVSKGCKNDIFVVKVAADHVIALVQAGILDRIVSRSLFLWCQRADKLGQAISLSIAGQNQQWSSYLTPTIPSSQLKYSSQDIAGKIRWIGVQEHGLATFFAFNGIRPLLVEYDWLVRHPQAVLNTVTRRVGVANLQIDPTKQRLQRQAGSINTEWRSRFLSDPYPSGP